SDVCSSDLINTAGLATAAGTGTSTIQATSGSVTGSTTLTVTAATLVSIAVTPANSSAPAGTSVQFDATGTYSDGSTKDLTNSVAWHSSNTGAATINTAGLATAVHAGQSTTISAATGGISGSTALAVTAAILKSITVSPTNPSGTVGSTIQFHATGIYSDNSKKDLTTSVLWASSNTNAAKISATGLATILSGGQESTISATAGSIFGS